MDIEKRRSMLRRRNFIVAGGGLLAGAGMSWLVAGTDALVSTDANGCRSTNLESDNKRQQVPMETGTVSQGFSYSLRSGYRTRRFQPTGFGET